MIRLHEQLRGVGLRAAPLDLDDASATRALFTICQQEKINEFTVQRT